MVNFSVICVTYNSYDIIEHTFNDILNRKDIEIFVINNSQDDKTLQVINNLNANNLKFIQNSNNIGYGRANNIGLELAKGDYILLINPDAEVKYDALQMLKDIMLTDNKIAVLAPELVSDRTDICCKYSQLTDVKYVIFGLVLIKQKYFKDINFFDDNIFMYFEDLDVCRRFLNFGLRVCISKGIRCYHFGGGSSVNSFKTTYIKESNREISRLYYKIKHFHYNFYTIHILYFVKYLFRFIFTIKLKTRYIKICRLCGVILSFKRGKII